MSSQTDLDMGGTFRQTKRVYMGPSVGWVITADQVILPVTSASATISRGNSLVTVSRNGAVTLQLPLAKANTAGVQAVPGDFPIVPLCIVDIGGFASSVNTITINRAGTETIDGLTSIVIDSPYGAFVLRPDVINGGWTLTQ